MVVIAYGTVVVLTWILVIMNVRSTVDQFLRDQNRVRLISYVSTLLILSTLIVGASSSIMSRVLDSETFIKMDMLSNPYVRYYRQEPLGQSNNASRARSPLRMPRPTGDVSGMEQISK